MPITEIQDAAQFQRELASAGNKLVVVDFTASWCGPCRMIAPEFERLSNLYSQVVFLKIDIDACDSLAAAHSISSVPTFVFFKSRAKVGQLRGASGRTIEDKILELSGVGASSSQPGGSETDGSTHNYAPYVELTSFITKSGCECLNESDDHPLARCLEPSKKSFLESDCDEQLIITLAFSQPIKLHSIKVIAPETYGPKTLKFFMNQPRSLDFDQADSAEPIQLLELKPSDLLEDAAPVQLKFVKFQNVNSLTIFVRDNQGKQETTRITQIILIGTPVAATNMNQFKRIGGKQGEAH